MSRVRPFWILIWVVGSILLLLLLAVLLLHGHGAQRYVFESRFLRAGMLAIRAPQHDLPLLWKTLSAWGLSIDLRIVAVIGAVFALETAVLGWHDSSLRRILQQRTATTRRDIVLFTAQIVGALPLLTMLFTFGAAYLLGLVAHSVLLSVLRLNLRLATGHLASDLAIYILLSTLIDYWNHRLIHTRAFWHLHRLHHTASEMNLITTGRNHPAVHALEGMTRVAVLAMVTTPVQVMLYWAMFLYTHQMLIHSNIRWDWGWIGRWVLVSPAGHRIHHSVLPEHHDRNFSPVLTLWDRLFGTWCPPAAERPDVGLIEDPATSTARPGLWRECLADLRRFGGDLLRSLGYTPAERSRG